MIPVSEAVEAANRLKDQLYFGRVADGDQRASSLFTRLLAWTLNPTGNLDSWGCLSKNPGESGVDGFSDDALCYGSDPSDLNNVIDMIGGAGAPGARLSDARTEPKERRATNLWVRPQKLSLEQMRYLNPAHEELNGGKPPVVVVPPPAGVDYSAAFANLAAQLQAMNFRMDAMDARADDTQARVKDVRETLKNGLAITVEATGSNRLLGSITLKGNGVAKG